MGRRQGGGKLFFHTPSRLAKSRGKRYTAMRVVGLGVERRPGQGGVGRGRGRAGRGFGIRGGWHRLAGVGAKL